MVLSNTGKCEFEDRDGNGLRIRCNSIFCRSPGGRFWTLWCSSPRSERSNQSSKCRRSGLCGAGFWIGVHTAVDHKGELVVEKKEDNHGLKVEVKGACIGVATRRDPICGSNFRNYHESGLLGPKALITVRMCCAVIAQARVKTQSMVHSQARIAMLILILLSTRPYIASDPLATLMIHLGSQS